MFADSRFIPGRDECDSMMAHAPNLFLEGKPRRISRSVYHLEKTWGGKCRPSAIE
jgi:hypothetical protein